MSVVDHRMWASSFQGVVVEVLQLNRRRTMQSTPITVEDAKTMLDRGQRVAFVDARNPVAWGAAKDKLPGAIRIPVDDVDQHISELPEGGTVITYCT
jgi:rhodanese-related sulfurtransferase